MLGVLAEEELRNILDLPAGQRYEFRERGTNQLITSSIPDIQTSLFFIEIKNSQDLRETEMNGDTAQKKYMRSLLQAARQQLIAQRYGRHSILMVGMQTEIDPEIACFYDMVVRAPTLGRQTAPDPLEELGAVGGVDPHAPTNPSQDYIMQVRGSQTQWVFTQEALRSFLLGHYPRRDIMEAIQEAPREQQLLTFLNLTEEMLRIQTALDLVTEEEQQAAQQLLLMADREPIQEEEPEPDDPHPLRHDPIEARQPTHMPGKKKHKKEEKAKQKQEAKAKRQQCVHSTQQKKRSTEEEKEQHAKIKKDKLKQEMNKAQSDLQAHINRMMHPRETPQNTSDNLKTAQESFHQQKAQIKSERNKAKKEKTEEVDPIFATLQETIQSIDPRIQDQASLDMLTQVLIEEGIQSREALEQLNQRARWSDRLRLMFGRAYQSVSHVVLPELLVHTMNNILFPDYQPQMAIGFLMLSLLPYEPILFAVLRSVSVRFMCEYLFSEIQNTLRNQLLPIYHDRHHEERRPGHTQQSSRRYLLSHNEGNRNTTLELGIDSLTQGTSYYEQYDRMLSDYQNRVGLGGNNLSIQQLEQIHAATTRMPPELSAHAEALELATTSNDNAFMRGFTRGMHTRGTTRGGNIAHQIFNTSRILTESTQRTPSQHRHNRDNTARIHQLLRTINIAQYISQTDHPGWDDFLQNTHSTTADFLIDPDLGNNPDTISIEERIRHILTPETLAHIQDRRSYTEQEQGIFTALIFNTSNHQQERNPITHQMEFREAVSTKNVALEPSIENTAISGVTTFLCYLINDLLLDNPDNENGIGNQIWLDPNNRERTRSAIRRLQGRQSFYRGPSYPRDFMRSVINAVIKEFHSKISLFVFYGNLFTFLLILAIDYVKTAQNNPLSNRAHQGNPEDRDDGPDENFRTKGTEGTELRRRNRRR